MAFPLNILELAASNHDCRDTFTQCAQLVAPGFDIERSVMSSLDTVYCNFFVAKPRFWREWLAKCELIFELAEQGVTPLGQALSRVVTYGTATAPAKVFVIERVASLLLWSQKQWTVECFNPIVLPQASAKLLQVAGGPDLMVLDALKVAYTKSGTEHYLALYRHFRDQIVQRANRAPGTDTAQSAGPPQAAASSGPVTTAPRGASRYDREIKVDSNDPLARFARRLPPGRQSSIWAVGPAFSAASRQASRRPALSMPWRAIRKPSPWPEGSIGTSSRPTCRTRTWLHCCRNANTTSSCSPT